MATLNEAEAARVDASEQLRQMGAHAVSVEDEQPDEAAPVAPADAVDIAGPGTGEHEAAESARPKRKQRSYVVVAYFDHDPPDELPEQIEVQTGKRKRIVPLKARQSPRFRPESLGVEEAE